MALLSGQRCLQAAIVADAPAPGELLRAGSRLEVYREAYRARLAGALRDNYEILHRAMGDEDFDALARAYIDTHPSSHASIRWFGDQLAAYMASLEGLRHPALIDFAVMDWALRSAFDGPDSVPLDPAALAVLPPEAWATLRLELGPTVARVHLAYAIEPAWHALRLAPSLDELPVLEAPAPHSHALLVWRSGLEAKWRSLDEAESALLQDLEDGKDFSALCERAAGKVGAVGAAGDAQAAAIVIQALQQWLADGLLRAL